MTRLAAVALALAVAGCGSESDTSQPGGSGGGGGSGYPAGYVLSGCSYICGSPSGSSADSSCSSGRATRVSCGGPTKQQCLPPSPCMTCYSMQWVCQ